MEKKLGKISECYFGLIDGRLGLHITFEGKSWGVSNSIWSWDYTVKIGDYTKWTEQEREEGFIDVIKKLSGYLKDAKVDRVEKLKEIPVEVTLNGNSFVEFRILTEVL